jgi:hypothetical protein
LEVRKCVPGPESPLVSLETAICKAIVVKLRLQWRPQEVEDVKNVEYLPSKASGSEQNQPKKEAMCDATIKNMGMGLYKPFGSHIMRHSALDARQRAAEFNVCPAGLQSCTGPIPLSYSLLE